jgi:hypothetical protein
MDIKHSASTPTMLGAPGGTIDLGGQHNVLAAHEILEGASDDFLRAAVGINFGGIKEADAQIERLTDKGTAFLLGQTPEMGALVGRALGHATQAEPGNLEAALAKSLVFHGSLLGWGMRLSVAGKPAKRT